MGIIEKKLKEALLTKSIITIALENREFTGYIIDLDDKCVEIIGEYGDEFASKIENIKNVYSKTNNFESKTLNAKKNEQPNSSRTMNLESPSTVDLISDAINKDNFELVKTLFKKHKKYLTIAEYDNLKQEFLKKHPEYISFFNSIESKQKGLHIIAKAATKDDKTLFSLGQQARAEGELEKAMHYWEKAIKK